MSEAKERIEWPADVEAVYNPAPLRGQTVGIIGYGWAAGAHIDSINKTPHAQVTAVYSARKLDDAEVSARHGCQIKTFTDYGEFLDANIQVVDICSMPSLHAEQAIAAARRESHAAEKARQAEG